MAKDFLGDEWFFDPELFKPRRLCRYAKDGSYEYAPHCWCKRCKLMGVYLRLYYKYIFKVKHPIEVFLYKIRKKLRTIRWFYWLYNQICWWYYFLPCIWDKEPTGCHRHLDCKLCTVSFPLCDKEGEYIGIVFGKHRNWVKAISLWKETRKEKKLERKREKDKKKNPGYQLREASEKGELRKIEKLLAKGVNINTRDTLGQTSLMCAASYGQRNAVEFLLSKGADPTLTVNYRECSTALELAKFKGHTEIVKLLESLTK